MIPALDPLTKIEQLLKMNELYNCCLTYYHDCSETQSFPLNADPEFVSSAFIQEDEKNNPTGEDDKIYFFFTEVAKEYDLYTKVKVPRVARVCKVGARLCCAFFLKIIKISFVQSFYALI